MWRSIYEWCMSAVPGPLRRRPKLTIFVCVAGAVGTLGSGLAGFTDVFEYFYDQTKQEKYVTHNQFNTMITPLVTNMEIIQQTLTQLDRRIQRLEHMQLSDKQKSTLQSLKKQRQNKQSEYENLYKTMERVRDMQRQQYDDDK